jgi:UDP-3-O-[3-hydroxymyristoyl] glucosamine N-acyltransferase
MTAAGSEMPATMPVRDDSIRRKECPDLHNHPAGLTVGEIAALTGAELRIGGITDHRITNVAPLHQARPCDLAFLGSAKYADGLASTQAGCCLLTERFASRAPSGLNVLRVQEPYRAFVTVARILFEAALRPASLFESTGVDLTAVVHRSALIESGVTVDPGAVVGPRAAIGAGTVIGANAVVGPDVRIGRDCSIGPGTSVIQAVIGDNVICHPGCRIGQDGFGYLMGANGHTKVPQLGRVIVQDDVEIGAGTTIDRGGSGDTIIGAGTKIDNQVHIAHNVVIGRNCIIAGQCGIAGSATLGDHVVLGGQVGISDHLTVGDGAMIGAKSGVVSDVPPGQRMMGYPAWPGREFLRVMATVRKLTGSGRKAG